MPALFAILVSNTKMPIENFLLRTERLISLMFLLDESHLLSFGLSVIEVSINFWHSHFTFSVSKKFNLLKW